ncbi:hypothetical protein [Pontibacter sp. H249]|uniref:hypothetical protein n=1 Tax=Pontibacter sp. H249 TaxID=3133420 RepID=UPI0030BCC656
MRKLTLLLLMLLPCFFVQAQDVLLKRNGDEIQVKVQEIGLEVIKYKRFDNLEGPVISIAKRDVFMIKYENGTKEVFNEVPPAYTPPADNRRYSYEQENLKLSGPRIGFTILTDKYRDNIREDYDTDVNAFMTQFGWQFETRVFTLDNGVSGLFEFVPLVGGLEQGKFLPSLSALIGVRGTKGMEFGFGPNVSLAGAGIVMAVGTNFQSQGVNFPVNFAFAPSKDGGRFSLLFGFNSRR